MKSRALQQLDCAVSTSFEWKIWSSCFPVFPGSAEAQMTWGGILKNLSIAYFIGNISVKKYQNLIMCVKVIASHRWDVFETRCRVLELSCGVVCVILRLAISVEHWLMTDGHTDTRRQLIPMLASVLRVKNLRVYDLYEWRGTTYMLHRMSQKTATVNQTVLLIIHQCSDV